MTATPSLTAVSHIAIATGSTAAHNDIPSNTYHNVAAPITQGVSGFPGAIGGYQISPLGPNPNPTAAPLWVRLREAGKRVVTATWSGADGIDVRINNVVVQPAQLTAAGSMSFSPVRVTGVLERKNKCIAHISQQSGNAENQPPGHRTTSDATKDCKQP